MTIRLMDSSDDRYSFEVLNNANSGFDGREFIVVDLAVDNKELRFKKELIADMLCYIAELGKEITWRELDKNIADIMQCRIHVI